jgi:hypothetical protein
MAPREKREWKCPSFEGLTPSVIDWAQLAAYIDGEGSILINTQRWNVKGGRSKGFGLALRVTVANTDVRLMQWCKETFGGTFAEANTSKYYEGKNWKHAYHWGAPNVRGAWILFNCLPYFKIKREQAEIGIQLQESVALTYRGYSQRVPEDVKAHRIGLKQRLLVLKSRGINGIPVPSGPISEAS